MLRLSVGRLTRLRMVLNTGLSFSSISVPAREELIMRELLPPLDTREFVLSDLTLSGHAIDDLNVRVRPRLAQLDIDGILGLDFLRQFTDIHFNVPSQRLTLRRELPPTSAR